VALSIQIVTPTQAVLDIECDEVAVPGANGELGLLSQHVPLISALRPGVLTMIKGGKRRHFVVGAGFAEIDDDKITILTGRCEESAEIDIDRAKLALSHAEEKLAALGPDEPLHAKYLRRAARAQARIDCASRS